MVNVLLGIIIGVPLGIYCYFKLLDGANENGRREATRVNSARLHLVV